MVPACQSNPGHTRKTLALQIYYELAMVAQCITKALKVHMVSHLQCVPNGVGGGGEGARGAITTASDVHSSLW